MPLFLQLALALAILITAAKVGGHLSLRLGQPAVLGSLLAGLILGPLLLDFLHWGLFSDIQLGETIHCLAELGVLLLMFMAGLDLQLSDLAKSGKAAVLVGTMGVILPVVMGYGLGRALSMAAVPAWRSMLTDETCTGVCVTCEPKCSIVPATMASKEDRT